MKLNSNIPFIHKFLTNIRVGGGLLFLILLTATCKGIDDVDSESMSAGDERGVFVLCEGNFNSGNSSLSYYNTSSRKVENNVFQRVNDRKLGDTGQSITIRDGVAYVAMENSGIIWGIDTRSFRVKGSLTAGQTDHMINPRYVHFVSSTKAYVTDLLSPYITVFNPQTFTFTKSIPTGQPSVSTYASTEQMAQWGKWVFTNCWCYSRNILVIDSEQDLVVDSIVLSSWQPKSIRMDARGKLWVITDGGYESSGDSFGDNRPHLYRIDAESRQIELDITLPTDEASVQLALNPEGNRLYLLNNDIYRMSISDTQLPATPFISAPTDANGKRHKLYGLDVDPSSGDIYVADAVDYSQSGIVYRYDASGSLIDQFRVGITPNGFAFCDAASTEVPQGSTSTQESLSLVDTIFEYMPAPGHQVNGYSVVGDFIRDGASMTEACDSVMSHFRKGWMVSLGAQGGYLVAGFARPVINSHSDYDLVLRGNPYSYQSEPGIVWVMADENADGLPNDTWYELKGSEYGTSNETLNYAITYYKPSSPASDIRWTDNQGGEGIVPYFPAWNTHPSYWQDWVPTTSSPEGECRTYYGSRLRDTHSYDTSTGLSLMPPFSWGYADNDGSDTKSSRTYLKLDNAVTSTGQPANLDHINFVKVQTAQTGYTPNLGEISTEVYGIWKRE